MTRRNEPDSFERDLQKAMRHADLPETLKRYLDESLVFTPARQERRLVTRVELWGRAALFISSSWKSGMVAATLVACFLMAGRYERGAHQAEATRQFARSEAITAQTMAYTLRQMQSKGFPVDLNDE